MAYRIGICGHFGGDQIFLDGQTVKTKILFRALAERYGKDAVFAVDTYGYRRHPFKLYQNLRRMAHTCDDILFLPAQNGVRVLLPLLRLLCRKMECGMHYVVIGGWLPRLLRTHDRLLRQAAGLTTIFVESRNMAEELSRLHINNAVVLPNCKELEIASPEHQPVFEHAPYPLCTFSRVTQQKGITDAVRVIRRINKKLSKTAFTLTVYVQVEDGYREEFEQLLRESDRTICYGGEIPFEQGALIVGQYFALLFPTRYATEGLPGTILDAYAGGTPVIAARWENAGEIIQEGGTGLLYPLGDVSALEQTLYEVLEHPEKILAMRKNCLLAAENYQPDQVLPVLYQRLKKQ